MVRETHDECDVNENIEQERIITERNVEIRDGEEIFDVVTYPMHPTYKPKGQEGMWSQNEIFQKVSSLSNDFPRGAYSICPK